ncbi:hypothetical protein M426DRAFT_8923 [Hypoxylon sp. CI-4A]|nr:hypothetical protein M426DRAFT_8923 [Hypoxylon sp. CI-4A]
MMIALERNLRSALTPYFPLTFDEADTASKLRQAAEILFDEDRLFCAKASIECLKEKVFDLAVPVPDMTFGYEADAVYSKNARQTLRELYNTDFISNGPGEGLYYPYFFVEFTSLSRDIFFGQNQCMNDTAAALKLADPVIPDGKENIVYNLAINDIEAMIYIGWTEKEIVEDRVIRKYKL